MFKICCNPDHQIFGFYGHATPMAEIKMRDLESLKWIGNISLPIVKINQSINVLINQLSNQRISSEVSIKRLVSSVARKQADVCHNQNCWLNVCTLKIAITTIYTKINLSYLKHWFLLLLKHHSFGVVYDLSPFFSILCTFMTVHEETESHFHCWHWRKIPEIFSNVRLRSSSI